MLIDGQFIAISGEQAQRGREQLEIPSEYFLAEATQFLHHHSGMGWIRFKLPSDYLVVAYENHSGHRRYGMVNLVTALH